MFRMILILSALSYTTHAQEKDEMYWKQVMEKIQHGRSYTLVFLRAGSKKGIDSTTAARIQKEHLIHLFKLHDQGKLAVWGPLADDTPLRGIAIFTVDSAGVEPILKEDPWVKAGGLVYEIHPWFSLPGLCLPK